MMTTTTTTTRLAVAVSHVYVCGNTPTINTSMLHCSTNSLSFLPLIIVFISITTIVAVVVIAMS